MARAFSIKEKEAITKVLIEKGRELFARQGLKRTNIAELSQSAGIAQGSFYSFFGSKEELLFAVIEEEEKQIHSTMFQAVSGNPTREKIKFLLVQGLAIAESNTIIRQLLDPEIYQRLVRKLPEEKVRQHIERDSITLEPLVRQWQEAGHLSGYKPPVVAGLLRAAFTMALHKQEIGEDIFPEVVELLAEIIAAGLIREEKQHD